jgi:uncharacterized protein (TIGR02145 family)
MKTDCFLLAASISFAAALAFSCSSSGNDEGGAAVSSSSGQSPSSSSNCELPAHAYSDSIEYEGKTYKTITIGGQTWLASNLNKEPGGKCYGNNPANCAKYGRLYTWSMAMALEDCDTIKCKSQIETPHRGICPVGWHIPSNAEWSALLNFAGGDSLAGTHLKAASCWAENGGLDTHKFAALPGGKGSFDGYFMNVGTFGYWWSSEEFNEKGSFDIYMRHDRERAALYLNGKDDLFSVRCVRDAEE